MANNAKRLALLCLAVYGTIGGYVAAAADCPEVGFFIVEPHSTPETRTVKWGDKTIFIHKVPITSTKDITDIKVITDAELLAGPDDALIQLKFTSPADQRLHETTTNHSGMRIAFLFGNIVMNNVVWKGEYGMDLGGVQVSINRGRQLAKAIPNAVKGCIARGH